MEQKNTGSIVFPDQVKDASNQLYSIVKTLSELVQGITNLRRQFRGEVYWQDEKGNSFWIQMVKPVFVKVDFKTGLPIKENTKMPWGEIKQTFIPNDEAIEEILSILYFMGINQITPITNLTEENLLDDLKEFELKLASLLALKQKEWGMDKELYHITMTKIKTIVQDVRYMARQGTTLKTLQINVQRIEQVMEGNKDGGRKPFG